MTRTLKKIQEILIDHAEQGELSEALVEVLTGGTAQRISAKSFKAAEILTTDAGVVIEITTEDVGKIEVHLTIQCYGDSGEEL